MLISQVIVNPTPVLPKQDTVLKPPTDVKQDHPATLPATPVTPSLFREQFKDWKRSLC
jgi:hypothetical protein